MPPGGRHRAVLTHDVRRRRDGRVADACAGQRQDDAAHPLHRHQPLEDAISAHVHVAEVLSEELDQPYFHELTRFVEEERSKQEVFPPDADVFNALKATPFQKVRVFLLGQDPYHDTGQAHGLCFSVLPAIKSKSACRIDNADKIVGIGL